jgi:hypothetical protein
MATTLEKGKRYVPRTSNSVTPFFEDAGDRHPGPAPDITDLQPSSKTMPLLMRALDELSKGKPLGQTISRSSARPCERRFVRLGRSTDLPYASGFTGPRAVCAAGRSA